MERVKKLVVVPVEKEQELYNKKTESNKKEKRYKREVQLPLTEETKRYIDRWSYIT